MTSLPLHENADITKCLAGLPRTLKIGAYDWTIVIEEGESDNAGQARFATDDIAIWPVNLTSAGHAVGTVLHECLHIIFENNGIGKMKRGKEEREEAIILGFESGLVSLFRDNPKLLTWMKKWLGRAPM
jgi:hypothetical protein